MIAVCRTYKIKSIRLEEGQLLHEICKRSDVIARAAIMRRWRAGAFDGQPPIFDFCNVEVAVNTEEMMLHIAQIFNKETGHVLLYEEVK